MKSINNVGNALGNGFRQKVVCNTPRDPVNKQAALVVRRANWISRPIPTADRTVTELTAEIAELKNELESASYRERALNGLLAKLRDKLTSIASENIALRRELNRLLITIRAK